MYEKLFINQKLQPWHQYGSFRLYPPNLMPTESPSGLQSNWLCSGRLVFISGRGQIFCQSDSESHSACNEIGTKRTILSEVKCAAGFI
jgi:hypothetical protein